MIQILLFNKISKEDTAKAGGKGASLGEMTQASIPVPGGFVITTNVFEAFLAETDLTQEIRKALDDVNHEDVNSVNDASEAIRELILHKEISHGLATQIQAAFSELNTEFVAVRSSATAEDGTDASWAGELETYLNTTSETLLENIKKCWASLFTPRAIFYRFEKGFDKSHVSVAVVVQKMIQSEVAGVAFSVHPVTQDKNQLIIEGAYGLGEAVVSGQLTPDSYVVDKSDWTLIDVNISSQDKGLFKTPEGGNEWKQIQAEKQDKQKLTDVQIVELAQLVSKIEEHYGFPVDVEWALEKGAFSITQSRPITTLN